MTVVAQLHLDEKGYKQKPHKYTGAISNRITEKITTVTPKQLAESLTSGHTALCGLMEGKRQKGNLKSQALAMLDFDNSKKVDGVEVKYTGTDYKTLAEVKNHPFIQSNASFLYRTFSSTPLHEKFRVVFFLSHPLENEAQVSTLYNRLFELFPQADLACSDSSRLFFGGVSYEEVNFNNVYEVTGDVLNATKVTKVEKVKNIAKTPQKANTDVLSYSPNGVSERMANGEVAELRHIFKDRFETQVPSISVAIEHLRHLPIREVFNLPSEGTFCDILHNESKPSATVFIDYEGKQRYYCHSASAPFDGDLISLVQSITGRNFHIVVQMLLVVFNIRIEKSSEEKYIYEQLELLINTMRDKDVLKREYPDVYKEFTRDRGVVANILSLIRDYTLYDYETDTVRCAIIMGQRKIADMVGVSLPSINRVLKKMENVGMIETLGEEEIPTSLYKMLIKSKKEGYRYHTNVTAVPQTGNLIEEVVSNCKVSRQAGGLTKGALTCKAVVLTHGEDKAKELFKQDAKTIDKGVVVSRTDRSNLTKLLAIAKRMIAEQGYAVEKELHKELRKANNYKKSSWDLERIKGVRGVLIEELGLKVVKVNKEVKEKINVEISYNTLIYVRKGF